MLPPEDEIDPRNILLEDFHPVRVNVDTEHKQDSDWCDLVVSVENKNGDRLEVSRHRVRDEGMIGETSPWGRLVEVCAWARVPGVAVRCPLCFVDGHGGLDCPRRARV